MEENVTEEKEFMEKKKGKVLVPIIVTIVILLVLVGGYIGYFYFYQNTERFIDNTSNSIEKFLNDNLKIDMLSNDNRDVNLKGNLNIQDLVDVDYDLTTSPSKELVAMDLNLKNILQGTINYQDGKTYIQAKDLYPEVLELSGSNTSTNFSLPDDEVLAQLDVNACLKNLVKYFFEALKEGKQTTTFKGLTEKVYTIEFDTITAENAMQKFKNLMQNDEALNTVFGNFASDDYGSFEPCEIKITVNVWTNKVKDFSLKNDESELKAHYDGEKYVLSDNGEKLYLWVEDDYLKIHTTETDDYTLGITLNYKTGMEFNYKDGEDSLNLSFNKTNDNNYKISGDLTSTDLKINLTGNIEETSETEATGEIALKITSGQETFNAKLTFNSLIKDNLIDKIDVSKAKKIDDLTEEEQNNIMLKLYGMLAQMGLLGGNI